jgi:membrane protease YdiL (CAAX protease family)
MLLFLPLGAVVVAEGPLSALLALATLWAIGFEAKRAAVRCVRWLDDADEEVERETPAWRALIAFASFVAVQAIVSRIFGGLLPDDLLVVLVYFAAAITLALLTLGARRPTPLRLWPRRPFTLLLAPLIGVATGMLGFGWVQLLQRMWPEIALRMEGPTPGTTTAAIWLIVTFAVAAPLAEETFFRGWLQEAIAIELPERRRRWAFVLAALAFAAAHPPLSFVPVLVAGLAFGALYTWSGGLLAGMLAHAAHNLMAVLLTG